MSRTTSVAMTETVDQQLRSLLLRKDGQEDLCLALYRPSTGRSRTTALIQHPLPPEPGDRRVHGIATIHGEYVLRGASIARAEDCGLVLLHSHPFGKGWQAMSGPDYDAESSFANLVREITGLPLVGMTLAGDGTWSARHWDHGVGSAVQPTHSTHARVVGDRLVISWNETLVPPPRPTAHQQRTVSAWGETTQANIARRKLLVVGAGSVGLDVAVRLVATGFEHVTIMDFDRVEPHNLDRLIGATRDDAAHRVPKVQVAAREALRNSTSESPQVRISNASVCEPKGLLEALDHDIIFCCVDRPWPRAVLNGLAYADLIPVIDGGIAIDTHADSTMRNATWRSHVVRPGRPCMVCNRQLDMASVALDIQGLLDDPVYINGATQGTPIDGGQNVALLSVSVTAGLLAQFVSHNVAPGGLGDPGPLQYVLSTHELDHLGNVPGEHCAYHPEPVGDARANMTGAHPAAETSRGSDSARHAQEPASHTVMSSEPQATLVIE